jgi:uncharacterized protein FAM221
MFETTEERIAGGRPVGGMPGVEAAGALTSFSSLIDGYLRMDGTGGALSSLLVLLVDITSQQC